MKFFALILTLVTTSLIGKEGIEMTINERIPQKITLSSNLHNRISVIDGGIETIIGSPHYFRIEIHEKIGQAFLSVIRPIESPQALTVITTSGMTQDFLIDAEEGEPTNLFLKESEALEEVAYKNSLATIETLSTILSGSGKVPHGYGKRPFLPIDTLDVGHLTPFISTIKVFEGALENIYVLHLTNPHRAPLMIDEALLMKTTEANWVFAPQKELLKNGSTPVVISKRRD